MNPQLFLNRAFLPIPGFKILSTLSIIRISLLLLSNNKEEINVHAFGIRLAGLNGVGMELLFADRFFYSPP